MDDIAGLLRDEFGQELTTINPELLAAAALNLWSGIPYDLPNITDKEHTSNGFRISLQLLAIELPELVKQSAGGNTQHKHLAASLSFELKDFVDAIETGKSHPVLDAWQEKKREVANRPAPRRKTIFLREIAVIAVEWMRAAGLTLEEAYVAVANIANNSGAFLHHTDHDGKITKRTIRYWRNNYGTTNTPAPTFSADLVEKLDLEPIVPPVVEHRSYRFWAEVIRRNFLAVEMPLVFQMMGMGIDPYEGYPFSQSENPNA